MVYAVKCHFKQYFSYIVVSQFYWWKKTACLEKTTRNSDEQAYHYTTSPWTLVVIGSDCTGSSKSNYHMITTMTVPTWNKYILDQIKKQHFQSKYLAVTSSLSDLLGHSKFWILHNHNLFSYVAVLMADIIGAVIK